MKIDILAHEGSPVGTVWQDIYGDAFDKRVGLGGAELALHTVCEMFASYGHEVRLYNNPKEPSMGKYSQLPVYTFVPEDYRNILIFFRTPYPDVDRCRAEKKIFWSCDQYTVGNFADFATHVDRVVCISPFHMKYFSDVYNIREPKMTYIDLPVRVDDYDLSIPKKRNQVIFCSVPYRGLDILGSMWGEISKAIPSVELVITSDYRLWTNEYSDSERFRAMFLGMENVTYLGSLKRREFIRHQLESVLQPYPCVYDELFCISTAECSYAGALPITSTFGALATTNMYRCIDGDPHTQEWQELFIDALKNEMNTPDEFRTNLRHKILERCSSYTVLHKWMEVFND